MRAILLAALLTAACSDDPQQLIDAAPVDAAYDTARCLITGHYGALGTKSGMATLGDTTLSVELDGGPPRDTFFIKLTAGKGAFAGGALMNGTYPLSGADLDFNNCGLCVSIIADIGTMGPTKFYFADAGTVALTNTRAPAGMASNVTFKEVTSSGAVVPGGCVASITSITFSM